MGLVDGKVCLVTGGASNPGLGHAIAHKLASEGAIVIVTDVDGDGAERTAAEIVAQGGQAQAWAQDVTDEALWDQTLDRIRTEHGKIDALINNAGIAVLKTLPELTLADYNRQLLVNMKCFFGYAKSGGIDEGNGRERVHYQHVLSRCAGGGPRLQRLCRGKGRCHRIH